MTDDSLDRMLDAVAGAECQLLRARRNSAGDNVRPQYRMALSILITQVQLTLDDLDAFHEFWTEERIQALKEVQERV